MNKRKIIPVILILLALLAGLGYRAYQARFVWLDEVRYEKITENLDLTGGLPEDLTVLKAFTGLKQLDVRGTGIGADTYEELRSWFPATQIFWDIPFQGSFFPMDTQELNVSALTEADLKDLAYFTELKSVTGRNCKDYAQLEQLRRERPDLQVRYDLFTGDGWYPFDTQELVLSGADGEELTRAMPYFTELKSLELKLPMIPVETILTLREAYPQVHIFWNLELAGIPVDEFTETLDLTGIPMTVEQMDAVLPYLLNLTYVDMTDCGISNEEMDALNRRYEDIKIVWTVNIGRRIRLRTDATYFMPRKLYVWVNTEDVYNLRYCTDLICIDIGHQTVHNCEWAAFMPNLQFLIIADTRITDISPLAGLENLVYLELFMTNVSDYSPLLECKGLEDLNIYYTYGDPNVIAQMTWLKNLWWRSSRLTEKDKQMLREALPDTRMEFTSYSSTGKGWRQLDNYYRQRDILGMEYNTT